VTENRHRGIPFTVAGAPLDTAALAVVLVHGRSQDPSYMREHVIDRLARSDLSYVLPGAADHTWYPESFLRPLEENQPHLDWALERMDDVRRHLREVGMEDGRIVWLGFSQGACLVTEYVARSPHRFGGLVAFTGGLIGPDRPGLTRPTHLAGLPALFTTSDPDAWVPVSRVEETVEIFRSAQAAVEYVVNHGAEHEIVDDSIARCQALLRLVAGDGARN
jgi:phospholipase/carboxylesterase